MFRGKNLLRNGKRPGPWMGGRTRAFAVNAGD